MTALAEALLAAQRQAIGVLNKAYVAGAFETDDDFYGALEKIGAHDAVDRQYLVAALDVLKTYGAPPPAVTRAERAPQKHSPAQRARIERTAKERNYTLPDFENLTMAQASEVIQTMDSGEYDAARWTVPF